MPNHKKASFDATKGLRAAVLHLESQSPACRPYIAEILERIADAVSVGGMEPKWSDACREFIDRCEEAREVRERAAVAEGFISVEPSIVDHLNAFSAHGSPQAAAKRFCLVAAELRDRHALSEVPVGFLTHCEEVSEGAEEDDAS